jgi:hypothetical protein
MTGPRRLLVPLAAAGVAAAGIALLLAGLSSTPSASALPAPQPSAIAIIGDFGSDSTAEHDVADLVRHLAPKAIVTTGDNLYGDTTYAAAVGAYYCAWISGAPVTDECPASRMASSNAFFPATGNHDYSDGGMNHYLSYFAALHRRATYAVTRGGIEFLVVDSQAALDSPASMARQLAWTRTRARASKAAWQVVVLHHPPFSSGSVHGSTPEFQWPFASWGVDLVLSGHDHGYERIVRGGLTYGVDGSGGADLYSFGSPIPGSAARDDADHGAVTLVAARSGLQGSFWATSGRLVDRFLVRP